jgi:hypothetical protein
MDMILLSLFTQLETTREDMSAQFDAHKKEAGRSWIMGVDEIKQAVTKSLLDVLLPKLQGMEHSIRALNTQQQQAASLLDAVALKSEVNAKFAEHSAASQQQSKSQELHIKRVEEQVTAHITKEVASVSSKLADISALTGAVQAAVERGRVENRESGSALGKAIADLARESRVVASREAAGNTVPNTALETRLEETHDVIRGIVKDAKTVIIETFKEATDRQTASMKSEHSGLLEAIKDSAAAQQANLKQATHVSSQAAATATAVERGLEIQLRELRDLKEVTQATASVVAGSRSMLDRQSDALGGLKSDTKAQLVKIEAAIAESAATLAQNAHRLGELRPAM